MIRSNLYAILTLIFLTFFLCKISGQQHVLKSEYLPENDTVLVVAPEENRPVEHVVYLLHGWNGNYRQWNKIANLQSLANHKNMLFVCPDGLNDSWYFNSVNGNDKIEYATFFVRDLIPFVDSVYTTHQKNRFIGGLSMGGYGAFYIYLKHPELFEAAISSSGAFDFSMPVMQNYGIDKRLGDYKKNKPLWDQLSMINLMKKADISKEHQFFIDCGTSDPFIKPNREVHNYLKKTPAKVHYLEMTGNHNANYWKKSLFIQLMLIQFI